MHFEPSHLHLAAECSGNGAAVASGVGSSWWTVVQMAVAGMGLTTGGPTVELVGTAGHPAPIAGEILVQMVIAGEVWG